MGTKFTPNQNKYNNVGQFRHWCQKVLPLAYDDSVSYYELLCKVLHYLNETIENINLVGEDMTKLYNVYEQLENWVNSYFDNLDIQEEINAKLDDMTYDGTLSAVFNERFVGYVTPQMFGAVGDGITNDTEAIQRAIEYASRVVFPRGRYLFNGVTVNKDMVIDFYDAELVPSYYDNSNNVFRNFFKFDNCNSVKLTGLKFIGTPTVNSGAKVVDTESIVEFNSCNSVYIKDCVVRNINLTNRKDTTQVFADRKGAVLTGIDTNVYIEGCTFDNISGEEWVWVCYRNEPNICSITVNNCVFTNGLGFSCVSALCGSATVKNCLFEGVNYNGSMVNLLSLNSAFENNTIKGCTVGSLVDCREDSIAYADSVSVCNNLVIGGVADYFTLFASKVAYIKQNVVTCRTFISTNAPIVGNILKGGDVDSIKLYVEGNISECLGHDTLHSHRGFLVIDYKTSDTGWSGGNSEVFIRNNTFYRCNSNINNVCISCIDVGKLIVEHNRLFFGTHHGTTAISFKAISLSLVGCESSTFEVYNNTFEGGNITTESVNNGVIILYGTVPLFELTCLLNVVTKYADGVASHNGVITNFIGNIEGNINITDATIV